MFEFLFAFFMAGSQPVIVYNVPLPATHQERVIQQDPRSVAYNVYRPRPTTAAYQTRVIQRVSRARPVKAKITPTSKKLKKTSGKKIEEQAIKRIGQYQKAIKGAAFKYGLDPDLIMSVVYVESRGNPDECSKAGACGLMQIMPETAEDLGFSHQDRFDPEKNIVMGAKYLNWLMGEKHGFDIHEALLAYNAGPGTAVYKIQKGYDVKKWPYTQEVLEVMSLM